MGYRVPNSLSQAYLNTASAYYSTGYSTYRDICVAVQPQFQPLNESKIATEAIKETIKDKEIKTDADDWFPTRSNSENAPRYESWI